MGYTTQEFTSTALTNMYPAYYKEFQIINWSYVDLVVTDNDGKQTILPRSATPVRESDACAVIEYRSGNGLRVQPDSSLSSRESRGVELPAKRINVPFDSFRSSPIRIEEFGCILSTVEQAMTAKNMACEVNFGTMVNETRQDVEMTDPRFVFQVIDPRNEFEALLVNVFGQTIVLRAGCYNQMIPSSTIKHDGATECGRLVCYLKYPMEYFSGAKSRQVVFDIPLRDIYLKEPFQIPSGDYVCVATNMEDLREIVAKKASCSKGIVTAGSISEKMIPKEIYEAAEANFKENCKRIQDEADQKLRTLTIQKNSELAELKAKNAELVRENESLKAKISSWERISEAQSKFDENRYRVETAAERYRREYLESARKDNENLLTALKIGGTVLSALASFGVAMMVKSSKK